MELTQLYFKLFPSVCLAQLWVVVCLKQAVSLVQEKPAVSRLLPTSGWQPSQNVPAGGRQGGGRDRKGRRESFSFLLQKTILVNIRSKSLQGLMGVTYFLEWWRGPELIIMKIMLRNTYNGIFSWDDSWPEILLCLHLHQVPPLFSLATLISWL